MCLKRGMCIYRRFTRGGSTFLGDIFNQHPAVFYWFEPLAGIYEAATHSETHVYDNGTIRYGQLVNVFVTFQFRDAVLRPMPDSTKRSCRKCS